MSYSDPQDVTFELTEFKPCEDFDEEKAMLSFYDYNMWFKNKTTLEINCTIVIKEDLDESLQVRPYNKLITNTLFKIIILTK